MLDFFKERAVAAERERDGHDTSNELLATLLRSQELHEQRRVRLKRELRLA